MITYDDHEVAADVCKNFLMSNMTAISLSMLAQQGSMSVSDMEGNVTGFPSCARAVPRLCFLVSVWVVMSSLLLN